MGNQWVTFRQPFWRWYLFAVVAGQVLFPLVNLIPAAAAPQQFGWNYFRATSPFGAAMIPLFMAPAIFLYVRIWTVRVGPAGLRGFTFWGRFVTVSWASIDRVTPAAIPLFPQLRVYSPEARRPIWLPAFLNDYRHFTERVARHAGGRHPLTLELLKRLPQDH